MAKAFHPVSDIHTEMLRKPYNFAIQEIPDTPILVMAGDVSAPLSREGQHLPAIAEFFRHCASIYETVLFVPGNHSFYGGSSGHDYAYARTLLRRLCAATGVTWLDNTTWDDGAGTRYIGATLWGEIPFGMDSDIYSELAFFVSDFAKIYMPAIQAYSSDSPAPGDEPNPAFLEACFEEINLPQIPALVAEEARGPGAPAAEAAEEPETGALPPYTGGLVAHANARKMKYTDVTAMHTYQQRLIQKHIEEAIADESVQNIVVVTHHPPTQSYHNFISNPRVAGVVNSDDAERTNAINGHLAGNTLAEITNNTQAFAKQVTWVCGHTHTTGDALLHTVTDQRVLVELLRDVHASREQDKGAEETLGARDPAECEVQFIPAERESVLDEGKLPVRLVMNCRGYPKQSMNGYDKQKRVVPGETGVTKHTGQVVSVTEWPTAAQTAVASPQAAATETTRTGCLGCTVI